MITTRPFAGRADEPDWVALREVVPAATAPLTVTTAADRSVLLVTVLPMAWPAMVRADGTVLLALQTAARSSDVARDLGQALTAALGEEPNSAVQGLERDDAAPRIADLLDPARLDVTVHAGFDFWLAGTADPTGMIAEAMERANAVAVPTERLTSVEAAYWCRMKERSHLRWVLPYDEEPALDALARLAAARELGLGEGTRYVGSFRAHGLLVPVWDLPHESTAADVEEPAARLRGRLEELLAGPRPLTDAEQRMRAGLLSRQLTLR